MKTRRIKKLQQRQGSLFHQTGGPHQCQCDSQCPRPAIKGKPYCAKHTQCPRISPITGWEPEYDPKLWNSRLEFRETHNCFSYAMNVFDKRQVAKCKGKPECDAPFHQPGTASGYERFTDRRPKTCPNMLARIFGDNPTVQMADFTSKCPDGFSKIALIIDESDDYHFLRQDSNGLWSHKPGARKVKNVDAFGHKIKDPRLANYNYALSDGASLNYDIFCSYMCVPRNRPLYMKAGGENPVTEEFS